MNQSINQSISQSVSQSTSAIIQKRRIGQSIVQPNKLVLKKMFFWFLFFLIDYFRSLLNLSFRCFCFVVIVVVAGPRWPVRHPVAVVVSLHRAPNTMGFLWGAFPRFAFVVWWFRTFCTNLHFDTKLSLTLFTSLSLVLSHFWSLIHPSNHPHIHSSIHPPCISTLSIDPRTRTS